MSEDRVHIPILRGSAVSQVFFFCANCWVAIFPVWCVAAYGPEFIYWDQFDYVPWFVSLTRGEFELTQILTPQSQYVQLVPNVIFVVLGYLSSWNPRFEMFLSLILSGASWWLISTAATRTFGPSRWRTWMLGFLLLCPTQLVNWLNGVQLVYFLPTFLFALPLYLGRYPRSQYWCGWVCAFFGTLSSANGAVLWGAIGIAVGLASPGPAGPELAGKDTKSNKPVCLFLRSFRSIGRWTVWLVGAVVSLVIYLRLGEVTGSIDVAHSVSIDTLTFFLAALGRVLEVSIFKAELEPIAAWQKPFAVAIGSGLIALWMWLVHQTRSSIRSLWLPLGLGVYGLGSAALIALGRSHHTPDQSLTTRYATFLLPFYCSLLLLLLARYPKIASRLAALALVWAVSIYGIATAKLNGYQALFQQQRSCWYTSKVAPGECIERWIYPERAVFLDRVSALEQIGYSRVNRARAIDEILRHALPGEVTATPVNGGTLLTGSVPSTETTKRPLVLTICSTGRSQSDLSDLPIERGMAVSDIRRLPFRTVIERNCEAPRVFAIQGP